MFADLVGAEAADQRQPAGLVLRIENVDQAQQIVGLERWAAFEPDRILDAARIFDMSVVELARAIADPDHVAGGGVPIAGGRIDAGEGLLEAEQQRLVAGVEIGGAERGVDGEGQSAGAHEIERAGNAVGQIGIGLRLRRAADRLQHPLMHVFEAGVAAFGESAQQIERRRRLAIGLDLTARIGTPRLLGEGDVVDDVAAIARQFLAVALLGRRGARLGELAGDAADLHHRRGAGIGEHDRHLQKDAEEIADIVGAVLGEAFRAIAALQQESLAIGDTAPSAFFRLRASPANTSGGNVASCFSMSASACRSG